jgi:hypothetical protein
MRRGERYNNGLVLKMFDDLATDKSGAAGNEHFISESSAKM